MSSERATGGKNHVRVAAELRAAGRIDRVVLCDVDERRAADLAERYECEYVTDVATLDVDAATLATPSPTHRELATDLLERDVDLLVEKPLALDSDAAWGIVDAADRRGRTLGVGHVFRHHPALRELKRRYDRGELGRLKYLHTNRFSFRIPRETTGVLHSLAVHDVDIYAFLLDRRPDTVHCRRDSFLREGIDETASLTLGYDDLTGVINASWQVPVFGKTRHLVAVGTRKTAFIDYLEPSTLELHDTAIHRTDGELRARDEGPTTLDVDTHEPLKAEVEDFVAACKSDRAPIASGEIGARTIELLDRAVASDRRSSVVRVADSAR